MRLSDLLEGDCRRHDDGVASLLPPLGLARLAIQLGELDPSDLDADALSAPTVLLRPA